MPRQFLHLLLLLLLSAKAFAADDWRPLDVANALQIETSKGVIIIELAPAIAPKAVERIKLLAREGVYDGLQFHRVIDGFVAQTGNPNNKDGGVSRHPDLAPEFMFNLAPTMNYAVVQQTSDTLSGVFGAMPFQAEPLAAAALLKRPPRAWGLYCTGAVGMGRQQDVNTANSEIFIMRAPSRRLERSYTVVGQVVSGLDVVTGLAVGEPPSTPDRMVRARIIGDLPESQRPRIEIMETASAAFAQSVAEVRAAKGADFTLCDVTVPARMAR